MGSHAERNPKKLTPTEQRKILRDAAKVITDIALQTVMYIDQITGTFTYFPNYTSEVDFGIIGKFFERDDNSEPKPGEKTHFELRLEKIAHPKTQKQIKEAAEFILNTLVEYSNALTKTENDTRNNPNIPDNEKFHFPVKLMEKIAKSEEQLNDLIEALSKKPDKSR